MPAPQPLRPVAFWASRRRATTRPSGGSGASSADVRSAAKLNTPPSSAQARSMLADEREVMPTRAPSETNRRAQAKPIPFEPPITTTFLPRNPRSIVRLLCPYYTVGEGRGNEKDRCLPRRLTMLGQHIACVFNRADCVQEGLDRALNLAGLIGQGQHRSSAPGWMAPCISRALNCRNCPF